MEFILRDGGLASKHNQNMFGSSDCLSQWLDGETLLVKYLDFARWMAIFFLVEENTWWFGDYKYDNEARPSTGIVYTHFRVRVFEAKNHLYRHHIYVGFITWIRKTMILQVSLEGNSGPCTSPQVPDSPSPPCTPPGRDPKNSWALL